MRWMGHLGAASMTVTVTGLAIALTVSMLGTAVVVTIGLAIDDYLYRREIARIRAQRPSK